MSSSHHHHGHASMGRESMNGLEDMPIEDMVDLLQFPVDDHQWHGAFLGYMEDADEAALLNPSFNALDLSRATSSNETAIMAGTPPQESASPQPPPPLRFSVGRAPSDARPGESKMKRPLSSIGSTSDRFERTGGLSTDRSERKKSREKMRRQEVNVKFDEIVALLGLSDKARKGHILAEAINTIKNLRRERDEMRKERQQMQQEISKLASCLQFSHLNASVPPLNPGLLQTSGLVGAFPGFNPGLPSGVNGGLGSKPMSTNLMSTMIAPKGSSGHDSAMDSSSRSPSLHSETSVG